MNGSLMDDLLGQLQGEPMGQIAAQLGTDTGTAGQAVGAALPMLLGALGRNAGQPGGADALLGALQRDHAGQGAVDLGGLLGAFAAVERPVVARPGAGWAICWAACWAVAPRPAGRWMRAASWAMSSAVRSHTPRPDWGRPRGSAVRRQGAC